MKTVFRIGDSVKVINPHIFVRCGYQLTVAKILDKYQETWKSDVQDLIQLILPNSELRVITLVKEAILKTLAHGHYLSVGCGGYEREIYTQTEQKIKDTTTIVIGKKIVKTGIYKYGDKYQPPHLSNQHSHIILQVCLDGDSLDDLNCFWIEAKNVEKISSQSATIKV